MNINQHNYITLISAMLGLLGIAAAIALFSLSFPLAIAQPPPIIQEYTYTPAVPTAEIVEIMEIVEMEVEEVETEATDSTAAMAEDLPSNSNAYDAYYGIYIEEEPAAMHRKPRYALTAEEKHLLKFVADREDSHSVESRQAVMQVVMNRVESGLFPNTVRDVLFQRNQFHVMPRYSVNYVPSEYASEALERLLYDECIFSGAEAIFFAARHIPPDRIARRLYLVAEIGGSRFWAQE